MGLRALQECRAWGLGLSAKARGLEVQGRTGGLWEGFLGEFTGGSWFKVYGLSGFRVFITNSEPFRVQVPIISQIRTYITTLFILNPST